MRRFSDEFHRFSRNHSSRGCGTVTRIAGRVAFSCVLLLAARALAAMPPDDLAALLKSATAFHQQGDYAHSIPLLKQIVQLSPHDYEANLLLGEDLLQSGSAQEALAPLHVAAEVKPEDEIPEVWLGRAAAKLGDFAAAAKALQPSVEWPGSSEQYLVTWADFCLDRTGDVGRALRTTKTGEAIMLRVTAESRQDGNANRASLLAQSAGGDPAQRGIWGEAGAAQLALGMNDKAQESLKEAEQREPQEADTLRLAALLAAMEQRWPEAERRLSAIGTRSPAELGRILAAWPPFLVPGAEANGKVWDCLRSPALPCPLTTAQPQGGKGLSVKELYAEGRWEQLIAHSAAAPADHTESLWRGVALARTEQCPKAIPLLELGLNAEMQAGGYWLEVCYAKAGARVMARLTAMGDSFALHELRGDMVLRLANDGGAAELEYEQALKLRPNDAHLLARLADAYARNGAPAQAKTAALAALAQDAHEYSAVHTLAMIAMSERDYASALTRLNQLLAMDPKDDWTQVQLGVANLQLEHNEEALRYLGPALKAGYPDKKGALHAMLARALRRLGRDEEARQAAAEAAKLADASLESGENGNTDAHQ
jgi:tetratricopeptide (TPR) repeat protein